MPRIAPPPQVLAAVRDYVHATPGTSLADVEAFVSANHPSSAIQAALAILLHSGQIVVVDGGCWCDTVTHCHTLDTTEASPAPAMPAGMRPCDHCQRPFVIQKTGQVYCVVGCRDAAAAERRRQKRAAKPAKPIGRPPKLVYPTTVEILTWFMGGTAAEGESLATVARRFGLTKSDMQRFLDEENPYSDPPMPWKEFDDPAAAYRLALEYHWGKRPSKKPPGLMRRIPNSHSLPLFELQLSD